MIRFKNINKIYQNEGNNYNVLKNISLTIDKGEFVLFMGRSGSGKSTLLNILTGVDTASSGEVTFHNNNILNFSEEKMTEWRGYNVGIVFQFFQLIPTLSVLENILLPMDLVNKIPLKDRSERAMGLLKTVGLYEHTTKMPSALSGGEQQRVAIARALANDVDLIVADEPTGNLDSKNADIIFELLNQLNKGGKTIIMVTHEREVLKGATRKILLKDGQIIEDLFLGKGANTI